MIKPKIEKPKVFISYAWTSDAYVNKVAAFASSLIKIGIEVLFDKFEMRPGNELNDFMEKSVKDATVTHVLLLLNKNYKDKADNRVGGVGKETQILSEELYNNVNQTKIIPVVFEKGDKGEIYKPAYLGSTYFVDLADESKYDSEFKLLVKSIYGETVYRKPELGKTPAWVTEEITFEPKISLLFATFKTQSNMDINNQNFILFLDDIKNKILDYDLAIDNTSNNDEFYKKYLGKYNGLLPLRDEFLELVKNSFYVNTPEKKIASFFEKIYNGLKNTPYQNKELISILIHELFIYSIAFFLKTEKYTEVGYLLGKSYSVNSCGEHLSTYYAFYSDQHNYLDDAVKLRDDKNYYTGTGNLWIENVKVDFCSKADFTLADILCFNYCLFGYRTDLVMHWFPITYVYGGSRYSGESVLAEFAVKLKTQEFFQECLRLFNYNTKDDFLTRYKEVEKQFQDGNIRDYRYQLAWESAPLLCQYTKSEDIGKYR